MIKLVTMEDYKIAYREERREKNVYKAIATTASVTLIVCLMATIAILAIAGVI